MGDPAAGHTGRKPFYRRRWFVAGSSIFFILFVVVPVLSPDESGGLGLVKERLSEAQSQNRSLRSELSAAERRVADLESELRSVGRADDVELQEQEKRAKRLDRRERKLDQRTKSLRKRARGLDAREADIAVREAAVEDEAAAVLSGGSDNADDAQESGCHPSYEGACVPIVSDVDCRGGSGDGPAYVGRISVVGPDAYDLDRDGDGVGCD